MSENDEPVMSQPVRSMWRNKFKEHGGVSSFDHKLGKPVLSITADGLMSFIEHVQEETLRMSTLLEEMGK